MTYSSVDRKTTWRMLLAALAKNVLPTPEDQPGRPLRDPRLTVRQQ